MNLRTISQLPQASDITGESFFNVSSPVPTQNNKYISQKLSFNTLSSTIQSSIQNSISEEFGLSSLTGTNIWKFAENIANQTFTFSGNKTFNGSLLLKATANTGDANHNTNYAATKNYVNQRILTKLGYFSTNMNIKNNAYIDPVNGTAPELTSVYKFEFEDLKEGENYIHTEEQTITETGQLMLYGWIQAPKNIPTSQAWIAIEGLVNNGQNWTILLVQPWVVGSKSAFLQYISFNIPIQSGLKIRIVSGFKPDNTSTAYGNEGLILMSGGSSSINTIAGYVLKTE